MLLPIGVKDTIARHYAWEVFAESVASQLEPPINSQNLKVMASYYVRACVSITPGASLELVNQAAQQGLDLAGVTPVQSAEFMSEFFTDAAILQYSTATQTS